MNKNELQEIRGNLELLYNESMLLARLRTDSPINHMVDGAMDIIEDVVVELAQEYVQAGRIKLAPGVYDTDNEQIGKYVRASFLKMVGQRGESREKEERAPHA